MGRLNHWEFFDERFANDAEILAKEGIALVGVNTECRELDRPVPGRDAEHKPAARKLIDRSRCLGSM
jgi:hypothetical protein